ncbi:hypothetical protein C7435_2727 [Maricaulis maris]|uniref:Uncharacterized protein n=1 Tax=Maricaulis maris TaxID=74318 RepID=A0A495D249_9PROT|nr:hypothetical protein C7435_2727 [Maricaulis maris]
MEIVSVISSEMLNVAIGVAGLVLGCISLLLQLIDKSGRR